MVRGASGSASDSKSDAVLITASIVTVASLVPVLLYQVGAITSLPDPPSRLFASDDITSSKMAHPLGVPDSVPGLVSFGSTVALILLAKRSRVARQLLGAKLLLDGSAAAFNTTRQVAAFGKLCSWCMGTAVAAGVTVYAGRSIILESLRRELVQPDPGTKCVVNDGMMKAEVSCFIMASSRIG